MHLSTVNQLINQPMIIDLLSHHIIIISVGGLALVVSFNIVTLRRARLILGWVTVCGRVNHLGITSHLDQLSLSSFRGR